MTRWRHRIESYNKGPCRLEPARACNLFNPPFAAADTWGKTRTPMCHSGRAAARGSLCPRHGCVP
jgi:hypothetical protein